MWSTWSYYVCMKTPFTNYVVNQIPVCVHAWRRHPQIKWSTRSHFVCLHEDIIHQSWGLPGPTRSHEMYEDVIHESRGLPGPTMCMKTWFTNHVVNQVPLCVHAWRHHPQITWSTRSHFVCMHEDVIHKSCGLPGPTMCAWRHHPPIMCSTRSYYVHVETSSQSDVWLMSPRSHYIIKVPFKTPPPHQVAMMETYQILLCSCECVIPKRCLVDVYMVPLYIPLRRPLTNLSLMTDTATLNTLNKNTSNCSKLKYILHSVC